MSGLFATDEEALLYYQNGKQVGSVLLVYGNDDGCDVIADYSLKLDPVLQGAITVSDALTCKYS